MNARRLGFLAVALVLVWAALAWLRGGPEEVRPRGAPQAKAAGRHERSADEGATGVLGMRPRTLRPAAGGIALVPATVAGERAGEQAALEGRVLDWATGLGVPAAEMVFAFEASAASTVTTEADGGFRFEPEQAGAYELAVVSAEGYLPFAPEWGYSPIRWSVRAGQRIGGVVVYLRPAVDYRVTVVDADERPVAGASVRVLDGPEALMPSARALVTGAGGEVVLNAPDDALLEAVHPRLGRGRARLEAQAQVSHRVTIALAAFEGASGHLAGTVVDAGGHPLADALVQAEHEGHGLHPSPLAVTGAEGEFRLEGLDPGSYAVTAAKDGFVRARGTAIALGAEDVRLTLVPGGVLRGRVVRASGDCSAVASFAVVVLERRGPFVQDVVAHQAVFDANGRFEILGLAPATYHVQALADGFAACEPVEVRVDMTAPAEVELRLPDGGALTGVVVDEASGAPLAGARATVEGRLGTGSSAVPFETSALADAAGRFALRGVAPGLRSILVAAFGHHLRIVSGLEVTAGAELGPLAIALAPLQPGETPRLELAGIGIGLAAEESGLVVRNVMPGGGAAEVGLASGDTIVAVDGHATTELGFEGSLQRIRGPEGTTVWLTVRKAGGATVELAVPRRKISG